MKIKIGNVINDEELNKDFKEPLYKRNLKEESNKEFIINLVIAFILAIIILVVYFY